MSIRGLYAIADTAILRDVDLESKVREALDGGAEMIQYRDKSGDQRKRLGHAHRLQQVCAEYGKALIVNDDPVLAHSVGAAGVHIGEHDDGIEHVRQVVGETSIIGVSCYNQLRLAHLAQRGGAQYVAFGSFFPSRVKPAAVCAPVELLRRARSELSIGIVAIGGITPQNGRALIEAGADALAVISAVFDQPDVVTAAARFSRLFPRPDNSPRVRS